MSVVEGLEGVIREEALYARSYGNEVFSDHLVGMLDGHLPDHLMECIKWGQVVHHKRPEVLEAIVELTGDCFAAAMLSLMRECDIAKACGRAVFNGEISSGSECLWNCPTHLPVLSKGVELPSWQKPIQRLLGKAETWRLTLVEWWEAQKKKGKSCG